MTNGPKQEIQWQIGFSATNTVANEHKMTEIQWQIVKCTPKYSHTTVRPKGRYY